MRSVDRARGRRSPIAIVIIVLLLAGCASIPLNPGEFASPEADAAVKRFAAPAAGGTIYIVRTNRHFLSGGGPVRVELDGKHVASIYQHQFVRLDVPSGRHRILTPGNPDDAVATVDLHDGDVVIIESDNSPGAIARVMGADEGRAAVREAGLVMAQTDQR